MSNTFAGAQYLRGTSISGNNSTATGESGEPDRTYHSVWFKWKAPASIESQIDTEGSDFDTYLYIYTGTTLTGLTLEESDDDDGEGRTSKIIFTPISGVTYYIKITGYASSTFGNYVLNYPDPNLIPIITITDEPPFPVTVNIAKPFDPYSGSSTKRSYLSRIEVWRSFGGPDPFRDPPGATRDSLGVKAALSYLRTAGRPNNSFDFQWWGPNGTNPWNGGPGSLDTGNRTAPYTIYETIMGQKGTHSTTDTSYTDGWRNSEIKYEIYDGAYTIFSLGPYLYKSPSDSYGNTQNFWAGGFEWLPAQTPPDYSAYQDPPNILANLLRARLVIEFTHRGNANLINVNCGDDLYYGSSNTTINLSREFIYSSINSVGDIRFNFEIVESRIFDAIPGVPTSTRSLTIDNTTAIDSYMELDFMSPSWDKFVYTYRIGITPPLRLNQRDDQQGLSPTARLDLSPSTSYQKSNSSRIFGGLYL